MEGGETSLLRRIAQTIERYGMFRPGMTVAAAVSGGADSVCLLHVLHALGYSLHVLHLNHNLRGEESRADAEFVRLLSESLGLPCTIRETHLPAAGNLEQAAREARLSFFREALASNLGGRVATGHTQSDQAETVLFRFLRGSGSAGLAAIRPVTSDGFVRPLIDVSREDVEQYLRQNQIPWRQDATNASREFARNRIRHQLLPQLEREWNPALRTTLAHTAEWALAEEAYWDEEVGRLASKYLQEKNGFVSIFCPVLREISPAPARRLVRRAIEIAKGDLRGIDFSHVSRILELAAAPRGHGRVQAPGLQVLRSFDWLRFEKNAERPPNYLLEVPVPGTVQIPGGFRISLELIENPETLGGTEYVYNGEVDGIDWRRLSGFLALRNWQPGDRYQPAGSTGIAKIKALFQNARVPLWERRQWPVLIAGESIVWTRRFGAAAAVVANSDSKAILKIREVETH